MSIFQNQEKMLQVVHSFVKPDGSLRRSNSREFVSDGEDYLLMLIVSANVDGIIEATMRVAIAMSYFVVWEYKTNYEYNDTKTGIVSISTAYERTHFKLCRGTIEEAEHLLMIALLSK